MHVLFLAMTMTGAAAAGNVPAPAKGATPPIAGAAQRITGDAAAAPCQLTAHVRNAAKYPPSLLREGVGGAVKFHFLVARDGTVSAFKLIEAPHPKLAATTEEAVRRWYFEPHRCGTPEGVWLGSYMTFEVPL